MSQKLRTGFLFRAAFHRCRVTYYWKAILSVTLATCIIWTLTGRGITITKSSKVDYCRSCPRDQRTPLIFIGGMPRSGTTLMRAMLDAHPDIRCGEETWVIQELIGIRRKWSTSKEVTDRLLQAGVTDDVMSSAFAAFILEIIANHGEPAQRLCNKDPFILRSLIDLAKMFPNAKFLLMIRDGRAVADSIVSRKVSIIGVNNKSLRSCLRLWNTVVEDMYKQCLTVTSSRCMPVFYEQLVLHPQALLQKVLQFLEVPWNESVLYHANHINKPGGVSLSKLESSTDQVVKPVNLEPLTKWVDTFPLSVRLGVRELAPMLNRLGYDTENYPPKYGQADALVINNTLSINNNKDYWEQKVIEVKQFTKTVQSYRNATL